MKQIITKVDVARVMEEMASQGRKITLSSLHAALNHRGSMTTLLRLKAEIESPAQPIADSAEGLQSFRQVWTLAVEEGRKQQEDVICRLKEDQQALISENERLDGKALAAENLVAELEAAKGAAEAQLAKVKGELELELRKSQTAHVEAVHQAREALARLASAQKAHSKETSALRQRLDSQAEQAHKLELDVARLKALLEAHGTVRGKAAGPRSPADQASGTSGL